LLHSRRACGWQGSASFNTGLKGGPRLFHSWWLAAIALCFVMTEHGLRSGRFDHVCRCDVRLHARNVNLGTAEAPLRGLPEFESEASSPFGVQAQGRRTRSARSDAGTEPAGWLESRHPSRDHSINLKKPFHRLLLKLVHPDCRLSERFSLCNIAKHRRPLVCALRREICVGSIQPPAPAPRAGISSGRVSN
jgi:hypothetical protein